MEALPISGLVNVSVAVSQAAAQAQNTTSLLALTSSTLLDTVTRFLSFASLSAVAAFFGTAGPEYAIAQLWFGQSPQPASLSFGRWAQVASAGQLLCAPLSVAQQAIGNFNAIADGGFQISVDGAAVHAVANILLTGVANLNAVATAINTALVAAAVGATCVWNGTNFVFTSGTTGAASSVSFLTPDVTGGVTDISGLLGGLATSSGAFVAPGIVAETALACATLMDNKFGSQWYAMVIAGAADADHLAVSAFLQATTTKHFYGVTTGEAGVLSAASVTDIAYLLAQTNATKTAVQYSSTNAYAIVSLLARIMTVNYAANNSAVTLMFKGEPSVVAESLSTTQLNALLAKNCNVFVSYQGGVNIIQPGTTCATNQFVDTSMGLDNLALDYQSALFNLLYTSTTKVPQTDAGMHQLLSAGEVVLLQYVRNGLLAPGTWTQPTVFGALNEGDYMEKGYYSYAPPVATQLPAARAARMAVPIQVAAKLAGAIQGANAVLTVNP